MDTLLKDFAEAFDAKLPELQILMTYDSAFFDEWTNKNAKKQIVLHQKAVDLLEDLYSNQADKISVPIVGIANVVNLSVTQIMNIIKSDKSKTFNRMITKADKEEEIKIRFKVIPYLLSLIEKSSNKIADVTDVRHITASESRMPYNYNGPVIESASVNESTSILSAATDSVTMPSSKKVKSYTAKKKKSKYAVSKTFIKEYAAPIRDIKAIRKFFLSSGEFKTDEVAVMSDEEVQKNFSEKYISIVFDTQTIIVCKDACISILNNIYLIPKE